MSSPATEIRCVECGGIAHLISFLPEDEPPDPGSVFAYRCSDCAERFDVVWVEDD